MHFKYLLIFLFIIPLASFGQQGWWAGLRLGDPTGVSVKYYKSRLATEFNLGSSYPLRGYDYRNYFYQKFPARGFEYQGYRNSSAFDFQFHILWSNPVKEVKNLRLYFGLGPQFRYRTFFYDFIDKDYPWTPLSGTYYGYDIGVDGTFGLEYMIPNLPLAVFIDGTLFLELADLPFALWPQLSVGVRYNFFGENQMKK